MFNVFSLKSKGVLLLVCFMMFFFSFFGNIFGVGFSQDWFSEFQKDSSLISEKTAYCKDKISYDGPLTVESSKDFTSSMQQGGCSEAVYKPYDSQFGLQSRIVSFFADSDSVNLDSYFKKVQIALALAMAAIMTVFLYTVYKLFGKRVSAIVLLFLIISPWIAVYSRNMYWFTFLMFLPFVFSFASYPFFKVKNLLWVFYSLVGIFFLAKLLNGYEHVTTLLVSALIPVIFYEVTIYNKRKIIDFLKPALLMFFVGLCALGGAIFINTASLASYYGSWTRSFNLVFARAEDRSKGVLKTQSYVVSGFKSTEPEVYDYIDKFYDLDQLSDGKAAPIKYAFISFLNYMFLPAISLPVVMREPFGSIIESIGFIGVISGILLYKLSNKLIIKRKTILALKYAYWLGLSGALSWLVLMPGHAYPHAHLNAIVFYMPFLLTCYIIIGLAISQFIMRHIGKR